MRPRAFVLLLLACLAGCAQTPPSYVTPRERDHPLVGKVWLPAAARFATPEELVAQARAADVVLLGETHDNADHHALQAWMLGRLLDTGRSRLVAFEMIDAGQQPALERHLAERPADVAGLAAALDWGKSGWPDWELYRPIFEVALRGGSQVTAANLTRPQVRAIAKEENAVTLPPCRPASVRPWSGRSRTAIAACCPMPPCPAWCGCSAAATR
ncbi:MAG: ChaN family lipoprotein [Magnetospirillum sp.]|nr:ChaN family lipoprotein [Magnetospirillum sp.]